MRAIILAAGRGRRLEPMGWTKPKCLLEVGGITLLDRTLSTLVANGVTDVTLVVGYQRSLIEEAARKHPITPRFIVNEHYETTNTVCSLWLAREAIVDDFLYFNADVLFFPEIVSRLLTHDRSALAVDEKQCGAEEVKVVVDADRRIHRIGKTLDPDVCAGEFIGVARFGASICADFVARLGDFNERSGLSDVFFEAALDELLDEHPVYAMPIADLPAIEIDTPEDYERAEALCRRRPLDDR